MNITIKGELTFFVRQYKNEDGSIRTLCQTSIDRKFDGKDSRPIRKSIDLIFDKSSFPAENLAKLSEDFAYTIDLENAWLNLTRFKRKNQNDYSYEVAIYIKTGKLVKKKAIDKAKRENALKVAREAKAQKSETNESPLNGADDTDLPF